MTAEVVEDTHGRQRQLKVGLDEATSQTRVK